MAKPVFRDLGVFSKTIINTVPTQQGGVLIPAILGFGRDWFSVSAEPVTKGATLQDNTANKITKVLNKVGDSPASSDYVIGVDVQISGDTLGVEWLDNPLLPPTITAYQIFATGGTFGVGSQFYVVTALNGLGETIASTEVEAIVPSGATNSIKISWSQVPRATSYKVYRSTVSGVYGPTSFVSQTANAFYLDVNVALTVGTPPLATTAFNKPIQNASFYVTYDYYKVKSDYAPRFVTSFGDIQTIYGGETINTGTFSAPIYTKNDIGLAASLIFDNGAQGMFVVQLNNIPTANPTQVNTLNNASGAGDITAAMKAGLSLLEAKDCYYVIPLSTIADVRQATFDHCTKMSSEDRRAERNGYCGFPSSTIVGDPTTAGTMTGIAKSFASLGGTLAQRMILTANGVTGREGFKDVTNDDGSVQTLTITGEFFSAILAGRQSGMTRITFPVNRKPVFGLKDIDTFSDEDRLFLQNNSVSIMDKVGETIVRVSRTITCAQDFIERQEPTGVQQIDVVAMDMREGLEQQYIVDGDATIDENTPILVQNSVNVRLRRDQNFKLISKFFPDKTKAVQNTDVPTLIDITYSFKLIYPFLNAEITQVISLS